MQNVDVTYECRKLKIFCFDASIDGFFLVKDEVARWHEQAFEGRQPHYVQGSRFVVWCNLEIFVLVPSEKNNFYTLVPNSWNRISNFAFGVLTPVIFSYLANHLSISCTSACGDLCHMVEVEIELTTLGLFLQTVCHGVVPHSATDDMTRVCCNNIILTVFLEDRLVDGLL